MEYQVLLAGIRPLPGCDWRSVVPYDSWSSDLLNNIRQAAVNAMAPQGNRAVQRNRTTTWVGPVGGDAPSSSTDTNFDHNVKLLAYLEAGRSRYVAKDPRMPNSWWEASWGLYPGGTWVFLGYAFAGHTEIDRGRAGECEFILAAQFPYDAGADSQPSRDAQKSAYLASKVMTRGQSNAFSRELRMLGDMDLFTAMVAGVPTQHEDPKSSVRTPNSTIMIHDNYPVNIPGMSEHSSKDFRWNRFTHEVSEFRPGIVLYKTSDPDPNMCINLFREADAYVCLHRWAS